MGKKNVERICKNCKLYDPKTSECSIVILFEGQRTRVPVLAHEPCFFEGQYFDPTTKSLESFTEEVQEVKFWVEDDKGKKTDGNGTVKIEYPEGFFGTNLRDIIK